MTSFAAQLMEKLSAVLLPIHCIYGKPTRCMEQIFDWENINKYYLNLTAAVCTYVHQIFLE